MATAELIVITQSFKDLTDSQLIEVINDDHRSTGAFIAQAVNHAIRCGEALNELKHRVPARTWEQWATDHLHVGKHQRTVYMRLARHQEVIQAHNVTSIKEAARLLARTGITVPPPSTDPSLVAEVKRLRADGWSYAAIGHELGITYATTRRMIDGNRERDAENNRRRNEAIRRAMRAARNEQVRKLAKTNGGDLASAYGHVRKALQRLEAAALSETCPKAK